MEVIKNETAPQIDLERVAKLTEDFDLMNQQLQTKEYSFSLTKEQTTFLMDVFYNEVDWKGYESYAISETYKVLSSQVKKGELNGKGRSEIVEAIFHFLKNYTSKGHLNASNHKAVCDQFAVSINEINNDRQKLRDLSLELVSAEQGIPIEDVVKQLESQR
jgi:hypothetical protein